MPEKIQVILSELRKTILERRRENLSEDIIKDFDILDFEVGLLEHMIKNRDGHFYIRDYYWIGELEKIVLKFDNYSVKDIIKKFEEIKKKIIQGTREK